MANSSEVTPGSDEYQSALKEPVSIIVPTYKEVDNIPLLLERVKKVREDTGLEIDVLFMDDNSEDGSEEAVAATGFDWARIIVRRENPGLSPSVIDGFRQARGQILVCMDCDLSHPPEKVPQMLLALAAGQEMVVGSRYVPGASTDDDWGFLRWLNSIVATLLARPLTQVNDPMSGFFALRKKDFDAALELNPVGYKIALELIVKCGFENIGEVPIHFADRIHGESKLTLKQQLLYIKHLRRLYLHKFANAMYLAQFLVVGASGVVVNLTVLTLLLLAGLPRQACLAGGIGISVVTNFLLNRRFTFSYARDGHIGRQFLGFVSASMVGLIINYMVALWLSGGAFKDVYGGLYLSALAGVVAGMGFNFLGNRFIVFRKRFIRR